MRLWSIHPKYLDRQGLLAVWREGLLAQKVLLGETEGYKNHPQLERFNQQTIQQYLHYICDEGLERNYKFDRSKILEKRRLNYKLSVTTGQLEYEFNHLQGKLHKRNTIKFQENYKKVGLLQNIEPHSLFKVVNGDIEKWEKVK